MDDNTIQIVYISDENYIALTGISIYSLLKNKKEDICIWLIDNGISRSSKEKLNEMISRFNEEINFVEAIDISEKFRIPKTIYSNISVYNNLFLASMLDLKKVIYIDGDTLILSSLKKLWDENIENYYIAGVRDTIGIVERAEAGIRKDELYINSGVMCCNLDLWRNNNIENRFIDYINNNPGEFVFRSQRVINGVCKEKILEISPEYNMLPDYVRLNHKQISKLHQTNNFCTDSELERCRVNVSSRRLMTDH